MNVLITSAGRRVSLLEAFRRDASDVYSPLRILACDSNPELSAACRRADGSFRQPEVGGGTYAEVLLDKCKDLGVTLIVPTIDTELEALAGLREELLREGINVVVSDTELIRKSADKAQTPRLMQTFDIRPPEIRDLNGPFPLFVKPRNGSSSKGVMLATSAADLRPEHVSDAFIFQEYMSPTEYDEITCDLYFDRQGRLRALVPRLRIGVRAGEMSKGKTLRDATYEFLLERMQSWKGARGCITVQVFASHDRSDIRVIEVNPRFGGGYPLTYAAGAHFPLWLMREYLLGEEIDFFDDWERDLMMLRYDEGVLVRAT